MGHIRVALGLGIAVLLVGCDTGDVGDGDDAPEQSAESGAPEDRGSHMASGDVGPIRYQFDPSQLLMAEVLVEVPPDHGEQLWGAKLIPSQRADMLGQELCQYEQSGRTETCETHKEPGLALALLTRRPDHYRDAFVRNGLEDELSPTQLGGARGFSFTAQAEGGGIEYRFLPLRDRTLLLARQFSGEQRLAEEAIEDVIRSVAEGMDNLRRHSG